MCSTERRFVLWKASPREAILPVYLLHLDCSYGQCLGSGVSYTLKSLFVKGRVCIYVYFRHLQFVFSLFLADEISSNICAVSLREKTKSIYLRVEIMSLIPKVNKALPGSQGKNSNRFWRVALNISSKGTHLLFKKRRDSDHANHKGKDSNFQRSFHTYFMYIKCEKPAYPYTWNPSNYNLSVFLMSPILAIL